MNSRDREWHRYTGVSRFGHDSELSAAVLTSGTPVALVSGGDIAAVIVQGATSNRSISDDTSSVSYLLLLAE